RARLERLVRPVRAARRAGAPARAHRPPVRRKDFAMNRVITRIAATLAVTLIAAFALAACDSHPKPPTFQGWMEADLIFVGPDEAGRVVQLFVREGDQVTLKAPVFNVDDDLQVADLQMQEATLKNAQLAYDRAVTLLKTNAGTQKA